MKLHTFLLILMVSAAVLLVAHWMGLWVTLGAHQWWSESVTWIGIGGGAVISCLSYALLPKSLKSTMIQAGVFLVLAVIAYAVSSYGKSDFVASYGEDAFAGTLWHKGFIGFTVLTYCCLAALSRFGRWSRKTL